MQSFWGAGCSIDVSPKYVRKGCRTGRVLEEKESVIGSDVCETLVYNEIKPETESDVLFSAGFTSMVGRGNAPNPQTQENKP